MPLLTSNVREKTLKHLILLLLIPMASFASDSSNENNEINNYATSLCTALYLFKLDMRRYPTNEEGLFKLLEPKPSDNGSAGVPYLTTIKSDPWGNQYKYEVNNKSFNVWSVGPDGLSNSEDDAGPNICE